MTFHELAVQDVGGGSVNDYVRNSLARIPLRWMVRECFRTETGILFHKDKFEDIGMDAASIYRQPLDPAKAGSDRPNPRLLTPTEKYRIETREKDPLPTNSLKLFRDPRFQSLIEQLKHRRFLGEEEEELLDSVSAVYDELEIHRWWRIVEHLRLPYRYWDNNDWKIGRQ